MITTVFKLVGGIGLFLMGMVLLTDGLKAFAGDALRRALMRFTGTPFKAFASGALVTLLVQSSSATTITVIGFVSAGLLSFPHAVGVVFGASLGTTGTGWIVSVLGLKVSVGFYALPLVGIGAFLKLLARGRARALGLALAGFGLIFIGIETLQEGMVGLSEVVNLANLPAGGFRGHLLAMAIGTVMTVIMQSSSAAVATTLTALHTNAVNFEQAASLVIGAAVGTTVTGALAAIGGSVPAKRTALAHVLFNLATGLIAVILLPLLLWGIGVAQEHAGLEPGATSLAAFHTAFIALGVILFLPWIRGFARAIERVLPDSGPVLTRHLDDTLLHAPAVALEATRRALAETAGELFQVLRDGLDHPLHRPPETRGSRIEQALDRTQEFLARIPPVSEDEPPSHARVSQMHAVDHVVRLHARLDPEPGGRRVWNRPRLHDAVALARSILDSGAAGLLGTAPDGWLNSLEAQAVDLAELRRRERREVLNRTATGASAPSETLEVLDAIRVLDRMGYHVWRICHHLAGPESANPAAVETQPHGDE